MTFTNTTTKERICWLKRMNTKVCNGDDENDWLSWITYCVPDCPLEDDFEYIADDEELFTDCVDWAIRHGFLK